MKKKSKFLAFCLSIVPGLGQLYLGLNQRAILFFGIFLGAVIGISAMGVLGSERSVVFLAFVFPLVWFVSMADALNMTDRVNHFRESPEASADLNKLNDFRYIEKDNRKLITLAFSLIPGAGHMYLGLLKQGAFLMACFFAAMTITGWLNLPVFSFVLPVIWFYSIFEVYHFIDRNGIASKTERLDLGRWLLERPRLIGWSLIAIGSLIVIVKIATPLVMPYLTPALISMLETGFVALILIAGGIKLVLGSPAEVEESAPADQPDDADINVDINKEALQ